MTPVAEPTFLALSGDAVNPAEGSNTEDGDGRVGSDASDFYEGVVDGSLAHEMATKQYTESLEEETERAKAVPLKMAVLMEQEPNMTH